MDLIAICQPGVIGQIDISQKQNMDSLHSNNTRMYILANIIEF